MTPAPSRRAPRLLAAAALLCAALPAAAIELSLEENRAARGNIGYVDVRRLFKLFPETVRERENFDEAVRQAEEQINQRKAAVIRLRMDLAQLKFDRERQAKTPEPPPAPPSPAPAPKPPEAARAPAELMPAATALAHLPGLAPSTFTVAASTQASPAEVAASSAAPQAVAAAAPAPPQTPAPAPSAASKLAELDSKIAAMAADIASRDAELKSRQAEAEANLLELESRRTEKLLGKIHKAVREVAQKEGVSVVVDKAAILFGQDAVDLTDKVLKALGGS